MAAQANEANTATNETPAKAAPLRALRLAFFVLVADCADLTTVRALRGRAAAYSWADKEILGRWLKGLFAALSIQGVPMGARLL